MRFYPNKACSLTTACLFPYSDVRAEEGQRKLGPQRLNESSGSFKSLWKQPKEGGLMVCRVIGHHDGEAG